jgi:hypothetical protein
MIKNNTWQRSEWTKRAYQLLQGLKEFPDDKKIIMVIRHSHRYDSNNIREHEKDHLTPLGHEVAREFGEQLPTDRPIRLFHSQVQRCRETAENIYKGLNQNGVRSEIIGTLSSLYDIKISPDDFYREATKYPLDRLLYRWSAGFYPENMVVPFKIYAKNAAYEIWSKLKESPERGIDLHVSHDFILMCLRLGWFGLYTGTQMPTYLSGFAFTLNQDELLVYDYDHFEKIEIPYWWNENL